MATESSSETPHLDEDTKRYIVRKLNSRRSEEYDLSFIVQELEQELAVLDEDEGLYQAHKADLRASSVGVSRVGSRLEEEEKLLAEVISEDVRLDEEIAKLEGQLAELDGVERSVLAWQNEEEQRAHGSKELADSLELQSANVKKEYDVLKCVNVLNDCFYIWHDGEFGTINGLRMGRLASNPVPWEEVNAAWGQCALLVSTLAKELRLVFKKYRLIPMGSYTKIAKLGEEVTAYDLCTTGGFFNKRRFDTAVCWFMTCVNDLGNHAEMVDRAMKLPYDMNGDKIGGVSLRLMQSTLADWTRACKYLLTNLKWLMIWSAKSRNQ